MTVPLHYYDLHQRPLWVDGEDPSLFAALEALTDGFFSAPQPLSTKPALHLRGQSVAHADALPRPDESDYPLTFAGTPEDGVPMRLLVRPPHEFLWLQQDVAVTLCNLKTLRAEAVVVQGRWSSWGFQTLIPLLAEWLGSQDMFLLHTGANLLPDKRSCVLFFGASGTGKTTTVLSLACHGWPLLCDDAGFLTLQHDGPFLWGVPRASKVHTRTFNLLPPLRQIPRQPIPGSDQWRVRFRDLPHVSPRERIPIGGVFLLQPRNATEHQIRPLAAATVLPSLIKGNMRVTNPAATGNAGRMFQALGGLCKTTPCYSLSVGPDLTTLPATILALPALEKQAC